MSELTMCNYCTLQRMKEVAEQRGCEVILEKDEQGWTGARYSDEQEPSAWFLELTDSCVC